MTTNRALKRALLRLHLLQGYFAAFDEAKHGEEIDALRQVLIRFDRKTKRLLVGRYLPKLTKYLPTDKAYPHHAFVGRYLLSTIWV